MGDPEKISRMPEGILVGSLWTMENECGWPACDSWRTLGLDILEEGGVTRTHALCMTHLPEFLDRRVLRNTGIVLTISTKSEPEPDLEVEPE